MNINKRYFLSDSHFDSHIAMSNFSTIDLDIEKQMFDIPGFSRSKQISTSEEEITKSKHPFNIYNALSKQDEYFRKKLTIVKPIEVFESIAKLSVSDGTVPESDDRSVTINSDTFDSCIFDLDTNFDIRPTFAPDRISKPRTAEFGVTFLGRDDCKKADSSVSEISESDSTFTSGVAFGGRHKIQMLPYDTLDALVSDCIKKRQTHSQTGFVSSESSDEFTKARTMTARRSLRPFAPPEASYDGHYDFIEE